jgi:thioredoxin 1
MRNLFLILLFILPVLANATDKTKVGFYKGDLMSIKETAKEEGKLYFYDFVASWCTPCRWMDETTYTDAALAKYISDNYVAAKVDIDDFDGFSLKEKYKVQVLPTIIVCNQEGKIIGRYEESMGASKMLEVLKKHNTAINGAGKVSKPNFLH